MYNKNLLSDVFSKSGFKNIIMLRKILSSMISLQIQNPIILVTWHEAFCIWCYNMIKSFNLHSCFTKGNLNALNFVTSFKSIWFSDVTRPLSAFLKKDSSLSFQESKQNVWILTSSISKCFDFWPIESIEFLLILPKPNLPRHSADVQ